MKKFLSVLLAVVFSLCFSKSTTLYAEISEPANQKLHIELNSDKKEYNGTEDITLTLSVSNSGDISRDILMEQFIPDGYKLADSSQELSKQVTVLSGEKADLVVKYSPEKKSEIKQPASPPTGENVPDGVVAAIVITALSLAVMIVAVVKKGNGKKFIALFICVSMASGTALSDFGMLRADAAGNTTKLTCVVKIDGTEKSLSGQVTYGDVEFDTDGDGLSDPIEDAYGTDKNKVDTDGDGFTDYQEITNMGTDPLKADVVESGTDTDGDDLDDLSELSYGTDIHSEDTDNDGLTDYDEVKKYNTDPLKVDTDNDTLSDLFEVENGLDPLKVSTDGVLKDSEVSIEQSIKEASISDLLLGEDNVAVPSVSGKVAGDMSENIFLAQSSDIAFKDNRSIVGKAVSIDAEDGYISGCKLSFDMSRYSKDINELYICTLDSDGLYQPVETTVEGTSLSCILDKSGDYFVININHLFDSLGLESESVEVLSATESNVINVSDIVRSSEVSGQADIAFVIDTTGSMSSAISNVIVNVTDFAQRLADEYNVQINYSLIQFRDIEVDGEDSTKIMASEGSNWYSGTDDFISAVKKLTVDGGGDAPESDIDGLETARQLDWRASADKFVILITDIGYKVANRYGIESLDQMTELLKNDGINVSVVTSKRSSSEYKSMYEATGGIFADIYGNFSEVLMQLADMIGKKTSDGKWFILDHGYRYVKLPGIPVDDGSDYDGDTLSDHYELGTPVEVDLTWLVKLRLKINGIPESEYTGKTSITVYDAVSDPTVDDTDGDGLRDDEDTAKWNKGLKNGIVGAVKICSYGDAPSSSAGISGHAYIAYTSFVKDELDLYGILVEKSDDTAKKDDDRDDEQETHVVSVIPDQVISIGSWAEWLPEKLRGTWINQEYMLYIEGTPSDQYSLIAYIDDSACQKMQKLTKKNCKWTLTYNCSAYAADIWNDVTDEKDLSPYAPWASPRSLSNKIKGRSGYELGAPMVSPRPSES